MYLIPGYVTYCKDGDAIVITSNLFHNKVKVTDLEYQKEFSHVIENGGCEKLATPLTKFLHEQELLATEGEIRCALNEAKTLLNKTLMITIMPTEGCNFRCPYCYEDHTPYTMTRKMLDRLEEFITEKASQFPVVRISWFGGEPTLCKDTVVEVSELVQSLAKKYHFEFASSMTTNGYLLNLDYFRQLYKGGIRCFQITLDGWDHDKSRPHVSGQGTLHQILDNLTALSALPQDLFDFRVIIRHNILEGDMDFSWYDHLYKLFGSDPRFMVAVRTANDWGGDKVASLNLLNGERKESLPKLHEAYLDRIGMKRDNCYDELFSRICYAAYPNGYIFRADGAIVKCSVALDHPRNKVGSLDPQLGVSLDENTNRLWYQSDLLPECYTCPDVLSCFNLQCRRDAVLYGGKPNCHRKSD